MKYMLDTNMCIYLMKYQPPQVAQRFAECRVGEVIMSVITFAELQYGVECNLATKKHNQRALTALTEDIKVVPFEEEAAICYGVVRAAIRHRQRDALDKLIAAHAIALKAILITNNEKDFEDYPDLKLENWVNIS